MLSFLMNHGIQMFTNFNSKFFQFLLHTFIKKTHTERLQTDFKSYVHVITLL